MALRIMQRNLLLERLSPHLYQYMSNNSINRESPILPMDSYNPIQMKVTLCLALPGPLNFCASRFQIIGQKLLLVIPKAKTLQITLWNNGPPIDEGKLSFTWDLGRRVAHRGQRFSGMILGEAGFRKTSLQIGYAPSHITSLNQEICTQTQSVCCRCSTMC